MLARAGSARQSPVPLPCGRSRSGRIGPSRDVQPAAIRLITSLRHAAGAQGLTPLHAHAPCARIRAIAMLPARLH